MYTVTAASREALIRLAESAGAYKAGIVAVEDIPFCPELRQLCESNQCGNYGKSWTCPPAVGKVEDLMRQAKGYQSALVYQTVSQLEDSFDIEGMQEGAKRHNSITDKVSKQVREVLGSDILQLSAGGCPICEVCAKKEEKPCRYPDRALASLETYGIFVSQLAELAGMKYINGVNTVTYFGAFFFHE